MIFRIFFLILIFISGVANAFAGDRCQNFKSGKFKLIDPAKGIEQVIERRENIQVETDLKTGQVNKFIINWLDDCEYELTIIQGAEETLNFYKNKTLVIRIIELYSDSYKFEGHIKGTGDYSAHLMVKID